MSAGRETHASEGEERRERRWMRLVGWLSAEHGMDTSPSGLRVESRASGDNGSGLFALESCPKTTPLFTIPAKALINTKTLKSLYPPPISGPNLTATQVVSLHLMLHRPIGDDDSLDPQFGPYISAMPREFDSHPLTWLVDSHLGSDGLSRTLCGLLPHSVGTSLQQASDRFWEDWRAVCRYVHTSPDVLDRASRKDRQISQFTENNKPFIRDYLWAWLNVNTRCIYYPIDPSRSSPNNLTLCPILDFANHTPSSTLIVPVFPSPNTVFAPGSKTRRGDYTFLSPSEPQILKDDEIFLKYGSHPNRTLFIEYGFVNLWKEGECTAGSFPAEVDLQDLVEALFEQRDATGAWMKEVLQQEGYWGDWTLHSSPPPAYPSYRLTTTLRLYQSFAECAHGPPSDAEARLARWRNVLAGRTESISETNEAGWRELLVTLCAKVAQRAREGLQRTEEPLHISGEKPGWLPWMLRNIRLLWLEELEVAKAVAESVHAGVDF